MSAKYIDIDIDHGCVVNSSEECWALNIEWSGATLFSQSVSWNYKQNHGNPIVQLGKKYKFCSNESYRKVKGRDASGLPMPTGT